MSRTYEALKNAEQERERDGVPKRIKDLIGYEGWKNLSFALQNGWVQGHKHLISEEAKHDVGVPNTVHHIVRPNESQYWFIISPWTHIFYQISDEKLPFFKKLMIEGYLLGTDFVSDILVQKPDLTHEKTGIVPDEHGSNQLEGELRRHFASRGGIKGKDEIRSIPITPLVLEDYVKHYRLHDSY